jgi:hypothetical protein
LKGLSFGRLWGWVLAVAFVAAFVGPVRAQDAPQIVGIATVEPARLEYTAAPGCHDEETFHDAVASFMKGADPFDENAAVVLRVTFKKVRGGYRGTLQKIPAEGEPWPEEERSGSTCDDAFNDIARLAAQSLSVPKPPTPPEELPELPAPETPQKPERLPPSPPATPPPAQPAPSRKVVARSLNPCGGSKHMNLSIGLSGILLLNMGYSDNVSPAFGLGLECRGMPPTWGGFGLSFGLEFRGVPPARVTVREPIDPEKATIPQRIDVSTWSGLVVPCLRFAKYFSACAVGQWGALIMMNGPQQHWSFTGALGPRLGVEIPFAERFAVLGLGEALFTPAPGGAGFKDPPIGDPQGKIPNVFWREPVVSGFIGVGVAVRFD